MNAGSCCHSFLKLHYSNCYIKIVVTVNAGSFANIIPAAGYNVAGGGSSFIITISLDTCRLEYHTGNVLCQRCAGVYNNCSVHLYRSKRHRTTMCFFR
ncbi:MAG: hypothetical protein U0T81_18430 [Saprospiraceae bacterium]